MSKTWTVEQRQAKLMQDINAAQKAGTLNAKQSKKMRKHLADIARDKKSMKAKNNGKLTADDAAKLQSALDDASNDLKDLKK